LTTIFFEATNHLHRWLIATEIHNAPSNAMTRGTRVILLWVVAASAVRPKPPFQGHGRDSKKQYRADFVTPAPINALESCFRTEGKAL